MKRGLIHAVLLDGQGGAKRLDWTQVNRWTPDQGELWIHLDYREYETKSWLFHESGLDVSVAETLVSSESRPRFTLLETGLLMAWRGVNYNPKAQPEDMVAIRIWKESGRMISSLSRDLASVNEIMMSFEKGRGPLTLGELLVDLADKMVWKIGDTVDNFEEDMSELENEVIESHQMSLRSDLSSLRRQVIAIRRYISPQKEALLRFSIEKLDWLTQNDRIQLREVVDRITRELEDLEAIRERAMVAQEELQNRISEQLNNRMYVLSIITAVFLPLGFLTGLLGVNVGGIPGAENPNAFRWFTLSLIGLVLLQIIVFKWRKWL